MFRLGLVRGDRCEPDRRVFWVARGGRTYGGGTARRAHHQYRGPGRKSGFPHAQAYTASKHGLVGLVRSAAIELGPHGITVNNVCPNHVTTGLGAWQNAYFSKVSSHDSVSSYLAAMAAHIPMRRAGRVKITASAVAFLCSDEAAYITAQIDERIGRGGAALTQALRVQAEGGIGRLILDRPAKRNAISQAMWRALPDAVLRLADDARVRVIVLQGEGWLPGSEYGRVQTRFMQIAPVPPLMRPTWRAI